MLNVNDLNTLRANPSNFLLSNIIFTPMGAAQPGIAIQNLSLVQSPYDTAAGFESASLVGGNQFQAYYLPWGQDASYYVDLRVAAQDPDLMFTGRLTGCAMGSQMVGGNCRVLHVNILGPNGETDPNAQRQALGDRVNINKQNYKLSDDDYNTYDPEKSANVIGVRQNGVWQLYAQYLRADNNGVTTVTDVIRLR